MYDPHHNAPTIFTNYLVITGIAVWHHDDFVLLMAFYGDPAEDCPLHFIEIECSFADLYSLLTELSQGSESFGYLVERAEAVMEELARVLAHPKEEPELLDLNDDDPLEFYEHVFSLAPALKEKGGLFRVPGEPAYRLCGYTRRDIGWPVWAEAYEVETKEERAAFLARLLVLRYGLFLAYFKKGMSHTEAEAIAGLPDPQLFALAKVQYELLAEAVRQRPGEYE